MPSNLPRSGAGSSRIGRGASWAALRPRQWLKNLAVFLPLLFARRGEDLHALLAAAATFVAFCLGASAGYLLNDVLDRERDRAHPHKRARPIAAGRLDVPVALVLAGTLAAAALAVAGSVGGPVLAWLAAYLALTASYSLWWKRLFVVDVLVLGGLLLVRIAAGGAAVSVEVSGWLFACGGLLALALGFGKRLAELDRALRLLPLPEREDRHEPFASRPALALHRQGVLRVLVPGIVLALVVTYACYTVAERTVHHVASGYGLAWSIPFALAAAVRYVAVVLLSGERAEDPAALLLGDRWLLGCVSAWFAVCVAVLYRP